MNKNVPALSVPVKIADCSHIAQTALERWNERIRNAASGEDVISILDFIGPGIFSDGITAKRVSAALRNIGDKPVRVDINSPGGSFFEGVAIYNVLREHTQKVTVHILGSAFSAAALIAMAGNEIRIAKSGFIMIHNVQSVAIGDRHEMEDTAKWLAPFDRSLADVYAAKTKIESAAIGKMLDKETWLSGQDAIDQGFADSFLPSDTIADGGASENQFSSNWKRLDTILAAQGYSRTDRRKFMGELKEDAKPDNSRTPSAAVDDKLRAIDDLLDSMTDEKSAA